ncbi:kinase-like domain-containing protein [Suillus placidus]|uniref:non-specific serine/threonine protein kinase n=1 Tax=Suillus placidus TaxID=48579 RepID=A0A9P7A008_9AGAM|nr:kinase-like domain-containing protein [Suillus placidus]
MYVGSVGILDATVMPHSFFLGSHLAAQPKIGYLNNHLHGSSFLRFLTRFENESQQRPHHLMKIENNALEFVQFHMYHGMVDVVSSLLGFAVIINALPNFKVFSRRVIHNPSILLQWPEEPLDLPADRNGGFYPATLGNKLNSTYTIVRKLGRGQHSSVWLWRYVAVKILTAHATQVQLQLSDELGFLQSVRDLARESRHPGQAHIVALLDSFEVSSTQGRHLCLVHEAMGIFPKVDRGLPIPLVKVVAKQLLLALDFLHHECHMVHTVMLELSVIGKDLKPDNILVELDNVDTAIKIREESRSVTPMQVVSSEPPSHAIRSRPIHVFSSDELLNLIQFSKLNVKLTDFEAYHLAHMPAMAGEAFDTTYFRTGKNFGKYFNNDGTLRIQVEEIRGLENALESYKVVGDDELFMCTSFLRSMLRLQPSDRASAADLLEHEWLKV